MVLVGLLQVQVEVREEEVVVIIILMAVRFKEIVAVELVMEITEGLQIIR